MIWSMYKENRTSRSEFVPIRGLKYHVLRWGPDTSGPGHCPPLVLLHGWMDVAASYQFMVDALPEAFAGTFSGPALAAGLGDIEVGVHLPAKTAVQRGVLVCPLRPCACHVFVWFLAVH